MANGRMYEWVSNWRAIWYLYKDIDGAQRGAFTLGFLPIIYS